MIYKGPNDIRSRHLRRLWEVKVYRGDPNVKKPKTKKETVVAFNHVEAIRCAGAPVAELPVPLTFVTWPESEAMGDFNIYEIESPKDGPTGKKVKPSIPVKSEQGWDF